MFDVIEDIVVNVCFTWLGLMFAGIIIMLIDNGIDKHFPIVTKGE